MISFQGVSAREKVHDGVWWKPENLILGIIVQSVAWLTCNTTVGFFIWCDVVNLASLAEWSGGKEE